MAKKSKSKTATKKRRKQKRAKSTVATKKKQSNRATRATAPKKKQKKVPTTTKRRTPHVIFEGSSKPKYACVYTAVEGVCVRFELNPTSGEYDLNPTRVSCGTCDHFVPPTG